MKTDPARFLYRTVAPAVDSSDSRPWVYRPATDHGLTFAERNCSLDCERGLARRLVQAGTWALVRTYLRSVHALRVDGLRNLPASGPFLLVSNHSSHFDALALAASIPVRRATQVTLLAAGDTFFCTKTRAALSSIILNALPVWRGACGSKALGTLRGRLQGHGEEQSEGPIMILFPEGTRSRTGELSRFKAGVGALVAGTRIPVVPCGLAGAHEAWPAGRTTPRRGAISLSIGAALAFEDRPNERGGWRQIAAELEAQVRLQVGAASRLGRPDCDAWDTAGPSAAVRRLGAESMG